MSDEAGSTMLEALRAANPVPAEQTAGRRDLPSAHALFADVVANRPRRVRTRVIIILIAIVLVALMAMAFVLVNREGASVTSGPVCYSVPNVHTPGLVVAVGGDPVRECAARWAAGEVGSGPVPHFDTCVLHSGVIAVFPGESGSVCPRL